MPVVTGTWSTNKAHISLLRKAGFQTLITKMDDRGIGIDAVYFIREPDEREGRHV